MLAAEYMNISASSEHGGLHGVFFIFLTFIINKAGACIVLLSIVVRLRSLLSHMWHTRLTRSQHILVHFQLLPNPCSFLVWTQDLLLCHLLLNLLPELLLFGSLPLQLLNLLEFIDRDNVTVSLNLYEATIDKGPNYFIDL